MAVSIRIHRLEDNPISKGICHSRSGEASLFPRVARMPNGIHAYSVSVYLLPIPE